MVCAASRSGAEGAGQGGVCGHISVPLAVHSASFRLMLACRGSCRDNTFSVNPGGGPTERANPDKAHHQGRSRPLPQWVLVSVAAGFPGRWESIFQAMVAALTLAMVFVPRSGLNFRVRAGRKPGHTTGTFSGAGSGSRRASM
jgi:hypothetical protein